MMGKPGPDELDQEQAFLTGFAAVTATYLHMLQAHGVNEQAAVALTRDWQVHYLRGVRDAEQAARDREADS